MLLSSNQEKRYLPSRQVVQTLNIILLGVLILFLLKPQYLLSNNIPSDFVLLKYILLAIIIIEILSKLSLRYSFRNVDKKIHDLQIQVHNLLLFHPQNKQYKEEQIITLRSVQESVRNLKTLVNQFHEESIQSVVNFQKKLDLSQKNTDNSKIQISDLLMRVNTLYKFTQDLQNTYNDNFSQVNNQNSIQRNAVLSLQSQLHSVISYLNNLINNFNSSAKSTNLPLYNSALLPLSFIDAPINPFESNLNTSKVTFNSIKTTNQVLIPNTDLTALINNCQSLMSKLDNKFFIDIKTSLSNLQYSTFDFLQETRELENLLSEIAGRETVVPETIDDTFIDDLQKNSRKENAMEVITRSYEALQRLLEKKVLFNLNKYLSQDLTSKRKEVFMKKLRKIISTRDSNIISQKKEIEEKIREYNHAQETGLSLQMQESFLSFFKKKNDLLNQLYS
jgi:hypothetical protein